MISLYKYTWDEDLIWNKCRWEISTTWLGFWIANMFLDCRVPIWNRKRTTTVGGFFKCFLNFDNFWHDAWLNEQPGFLDYCTILSMEIFKVKIKLGIQSEFRPGVLSFNSFFNRLWSDYVIKSGIMQPNLVFSMWRLVCGCWERDFNASVPKNPRIPESERCVSVLISFRCKLGKIPLLKTVCEFPVAVALDVLLIWFSRLETLQT